MSKLVFLFPGQGSQQIGMASQLYSNWGWFRQQLDEWFALANDFQLAPLHEVMLGLNGQGPRLVETQYTQPILYALEVGLARLWQRWGIQPDTVMGHSLGEIPAAVLAGVISDQEGMEMALVRGRLMQNLRIKGKYAVVIGESSDVIELVQKRSPRVFVGGSNGPNLTVISGYEDAVDELIQILKQRGMTVRVLNVNLPFHSPLMQPMLDDFAFEMNHVQFSMPKLEWFSTMTGECLKGDECVDINYWQSQIIEPVQFWCAMYAVSESDACVFLELGAGNTLIRMGRDAIDPERHSWLASLDAKRSDAEALSQSAERLHSLGFSVDMNRVAADKLEILNA